MKVAHVITRMIIGGAQENTLLNCLDLIDDFGDDVLLLCGPSLGPEGSLLDKVGITSLEKDPRGSYEQPAPQSDTPVSSDEGRAGRSASRQPECQDAISHSSARDVATHVVADRLPVRLVRSLRRNIHPWHDALAYRELRQVISDFGPDVVHTHSAKGGLLGRLTGWRCMTPAVIHSVHGAPFHDYQSVLARRFFVACERWAAKRCHHLISVADAMTDLMVDAGVTTRDRFTTIASGMNVDPFLTADNHRDAVRSQYGFQSHHVVIGKIARLFHLKGHDDVITAAADVIHENPNVRFLWVGDGVLRPTLQARIDQLGLTSHFVLTGLVPPARVAELIGGMDLLVHASYREGLARALPQTLIAGKPVISYDIDGAREVTIPGETGCLVDPGDTGGLASAMSLLARDADQRRRLGQAGRERFTDRFRHQTMTREIRALYQRCIEASTGFRQSS
ncbi:MAG: glycosyltransferase family 4 protein [Planctomycetota bacterium]